LLYKLERRAHRIEWRNLKNARVVEIEDALVLIFLEQGFKYSAGLRAVFGEDVAFADIIGTLTAGKRRSVKRDMANEVEGIEVFTYLVRERIKRKPFVCEFFDDRLLALCSVPAAEKVIETGKTLLEGLFRKIPQAFGDELAVFVEVFHALSEDGGTNPVHINLASPLYVGLYGDVRWFAIDDHFVIAGFYWKGGFIIAAGGHVIGRGNGIILARLVNLDWVAVEVGIGEVAGCAAEIYDSEIEFPGVLMDASAAPDDLLRNGTKITSVLSGNMIL